MSHLAMEFGDWPGYTWSGTFLATLLPAAVVGALIGVDWQRRRDSMRRVPLVVWSPLLLIVGPAVVAEDFIGTLVDTGEGWGAISVVLIGLCGAFAISARGPAWRRVLAGLAALGVTATMLFQFYLAGSGVTPSGVFGGVHLVVLLAWLSLVCSLPMGQQPRATPPPGTAPPERASAETVAARAGLNQPLGSATAKRRPSSRMASPSRAADR